MTVSGKKEIDPRTTIHAFQDFNNLGSKLHDGTRKFLHRHEPTTDSKNVKLQNTLINALVRSFHKDKEMIERLKRKACGELITSKSLKKNLKKTESNYCYEWTKKTSNPSTWTGDGRQLFQSIYRNRIPSFYFY